MATRRNSVTLQSLAIFFFMTPTCNVVLAQKSFSNNWVKIATDQYGFVTGSNQKDSLYFVTLTNGKVTRDDYEIDVIFSGGKGNRKAKYIDQFEFSGGNLALYLYIGRAARDVDTKYYEELQPSDNQNYSLLVDGAPPDRPELTHPYIHKKHKAVFQEMASSRSEVLYLNKSGGIVQQGMPLLNESGKAVVGIVANNDGAIGDRFSIIKITTIAERLERWDRNACRYFNLIKAGESMTPCEREEKRKEEERLRHIREDIERKNRTRQERRDVRRNSDYWFSAAPSFSWNFYSLTLKNDTGKEKASGIGYSIGLNILVNPNPNSFTFSLRPRYTITSMNMPDNFVVRPGSSLQLQGLSMRSYEIPIIWETSEIGLFLGLGYVPSFIANTTFTYKLSNEQAIRKDKVFDGPKYLHKLHFEGGVQSKNFRVTLYYQHQFGTFINKKYEMIIESQVVQPFDGFKKRYYTWGIEISYRLWSQWRPISKKV